MYDYCDKTENKLDMRRANKDTHILFLFISTEIIKRRNCEGNMNVWWLECCVTVPSIENAPQSTTEWRCCIRLHARTHAHNSFPKKTGFEWKTKVWRVKSAKVLRNSFWSCKLQRRPECVYLFVCVRYWAGDATVAVLGHYILMWFCGSPLAFTFREIIKCDWVVQARTVCRL